MKVYFYEKNKLKYFLIVDDISIDLQKKKVYITKNKAYFSPIRFMKSKIKKEKIFIYCDKISIDFNWNRDY